MISPPHIFLACLLLASALPARAFLVPDATGGRSGRLAVSVAPRLLSMVTDSTSPLGGDVSIGYVRDSSGYPWDRTLPEGVTLEEQVNDVDMVASSTIDPGVGGTRTISITADDCMRPNVVTRPGSAPNSDWDYSGQQEITSVTHGGFSISTPRDANTGTVSSRTLGHLGVTDSFVYNNSQWLVSESRPGYSATYDYDPDGRRDFTIINGRRTDYEIDGLGAVTAVINAQVGGKLLAVVAGDVFPATTAKAGVKAVFRARGSEPFTTPATVYLPAGTQAGNVRVRDTGIFADDFDDGAGALWTALNESTVGLAGLDQDQIIFTSSGYAPQFTAAAGQYAYLEKTFGVTKDYFGIAFRLYPTQANLTNDGDEALVLRSRDDGQTRLELVLVNVQGGIDLMARYWADVGNGSPVGRPRKRESETV